MLWHARNIGIRALPCSYGALRDMGRWPFRHVTPVAATNLHRHRPRKRWWGTHDSSSPLPWFRRKPGENPYTLPTLGSSTTKRVWAHETRTSHLVAALLSKNGNAWWEISGTWHAQGATAFYLCSFLQGRGPEHNDQYSLYSSGHHFQRQNQVN